MTLLLLTLAAACPSISADLTGDAWTREASRTFRAELAVETSRSSRCPADAPHLVVDWQPSSPIGVTVTWRTGATERTLRRTVDPAAVPADGLMLALAAVAGELLRETEEQWPEARVAEAAPVEAPRRTVAVLARLTGAVYSGGSTFGGAALALRIALPARLELDLSAGGRGALTRHSELGTVTLAGAQGALGLGVRLAEWSTVTLGLLAQAEVGWIFTGLFANDGATARAGGGLVASARGGLELVFRPGASWWMLSLTGGAPLKGLALTDGTRAVAAVSGFEGQLTLSAGPAW